jgi:predicted glycosyltransferase
MTTESAILGTPAICISSWACECGNFIDLSSNYGLINCFKDGEKALKKGIGLMNEDSKKKWRRKSKKLLEDKIDVTEFMKEEVTKAAVN